MKHCPQCNKNYADPTLSFCLEDGAPLIFGAAVEEPATAILSGDPVSESPTTSFDQKTPVSNDFGATPTTVSKTSFSYTRLLVVSVLCLVVIAVAGFGYRYYYSARTKQIESVAVMPFVNESADPQVEYLTDGMTDTLIRSLSELPNVKVKARTSVFRYKGKEIDPKTVGKELGVQAVVNGRLSQRDGRTNVSLEVIDAETEDVILSTNYDKPQSELVTLQSDIARDVSAKLRNKLSGAEQAKIAKTYTADPAAYQLYLKGDFYWHKRGRENLLRATDYFNQAIQKDPNYGLAYAGLAMTFTLYADYNVASPADSFPKLKAAADRALELDDSLAEAHAALGGYYAVWEWDFVTAEREYRQAIALNPNFATAHHWVSTDVLCNLRRFDEALAEAKKGQDLDPLSSIITANVGDIYQYAGRYDEAISTYRRAEELDPTFYFPPQALGTVYLLKGEVPDAIASLRKSLELNPGDPYVMSALANALTRTGQRDEAVKLVDEIKSMTANKFVPGEAVAFAYLALGNKDEALSWLEKAVDQHSREAVLLAVDPVFADLRSEPRYKALMKRVNLPE